MVDYKIFRIKLLSKHFQAAVVGAFCQSNLCCQKFGVNTSQVSSFPSHLEAVFSTYYIFIDINNMILRVNVPDTERKVQKRSLSVICI